MGLVISLLAMGLVFAVGIGILLSAGSDLEISANERSRSSAFYAAEAGLESAQVSLGADAGWAASILDFSTSPPGLVDPFPDTLTIDGTTVTLDTENGEVVEGYYPLGSSSSLANGSTYERELWLPPVELVPANASGSKLWIVVPARTTGSQGGAEASVQRVRADIRVQASLVSVWNNAIFAANGQSGTVINGNAQVRGSVHILGDQDNPPTLEWSGNAGVYNNYEGIDDSGNFGADAAKIPTLPTTEIDGETVESLDAEVRIQSADLEIGGNANIGDSDSSGNGYKETVDGFYSDGSVDISGSAGIYADEQGGYDLDEAAQFPSLDDPYVDDDGTYWNSHRDYLDGESLTITVSSIDRNTAAFSTSDAKGNSISWDPSTGVLDVNGIIRIDGSISLGADHERIEYEGSGSFYATDDIELHSDLVPTGNYLDETASTTNNLGLFADDDVAIATGGGDSWIKIMAAIYAEDEARIVKQTRIAGAIVATYFDMGTNVPAVFQVPKLAGNLPPGAPGPDPVLAIWKTELSAWYHER